jgi:hypothetical protein
MAKTVQVSTLFLKAPSSHSASIGCVQIITITLINFIHVEWNKCIVCCSSLLSIWPSNYY